MAAARAMNHAKPARRVIVAALLVFHLAASVGPKGSLGFGLFAGAATGIRWVNMSLGVIYLFEQRSEAECFSSVAEPRVKRRPIEAQSTAIARAMASICNDERASLGVMSGHDRKILSLSFKPWLINNGYQVLTYTVMGGVIGA